MKITARRIEDLRNKMREEGMDYYLMTSSDYHASEYVGDFFKVTEYFSGCTSDNATLLVGSKISKLWTDGRYFISAAQELEDSGTELMKMGEPGVPSAEEYLGRTLKAGEVLGFDGRCVDTVLGKKMEKIAESAGAKIKSDRDVAGEAFPDRPALPCHPVYLIPDEISGESAEEKIAWVRERMEEAGAEYFMLSKLDDLNWLLNMRGNDVFCNPVALGYALIGRSSFDLFLQSAELTGDFMAYAERCKITIREYNDILSFLEQYDFRGPVLTDPSYTSFRILQILQQRTRVIFGENPTELRKAVKNPVEIENLQQFYLLDSVALCRFLCWFRKNAGKTKITELSAAAYLDSLRAEIPGYIELSFPTISAYGKNAAMAHYAATLESDAEILPESFLLVDSGGQYLGGTTDVTRTMAAGSLTPEMKRDFTLVAVSNLALLNAKFLYGCTGKNLDTFARAPLWEYGLNYNHGTGHGIGYILNVHEGPQNIRWKFNPEQKEAVLESGMILSDEPGIYIEGKYGIRTETIVLTVNAEKNEYGQFMKFVPLTFAPVDLEAIDLNYMQPLDRKRLNAYHLAVREKISPFLEGEELSWLIEATREI